MRKKKNEAELQRAKSRQSVLDRSCEKRYMSLKKKIKMTTTKKQKEKEDNTTEEKEIIDLKQKKKDAHLGKQQK